MKNQYTPQLYLGDSTKVLKKIPKDSIDLIITSPPYSNQRKDSYGGTHPDKYINWFLPIAAELFRVLKPNGTFILNIKEKVHKGQRHTYVIKLILALIQMGWLWTEEFIWHKKNSVPGKWPNRFRDGWERLLQFNKQRQFNMYQEAVVIPANTTPTKKKLEKKKNIIKSGTGSRFVINPSKWKDRGWVYPTNVVHLSTENRNKGHSAAFPDTLPTWFIKLFTKKGDIVLDPFMGSGTTNKVAQQLQRNSIGIEIKKEYFKLVQEKIK
jgi:DNA modification methylase